SAAIVPGRRSEVHRQTATGGAASFDILLAAGAHSRATCHAAGQDFLASADLDVGPARLTIGPDYLEPPTLYGARTHEPAIPDKLHRADVLPLAAHTPADENRNTP